MTTLKLKLSSRLPSTQQIWPVFSTIVFIIFTWMLYNFFFQIPSWLFYMKAAEILILLAYVMSYSLIESLLVLAFVLLLCMIFPASYFKNQFDALGSIQVFIISAIFYILRQRMGTFSKLEVENQINVLVATLLSILVGLVLSVIIVSKIFERFPVLSRWTSSLANRMIIFSYIYVPLGLLGLLVVIIRNIF